MLYTRQVVWIVTHVDITMTNMTGKLHIDTNLTLFFQFGNDRLKGTLKQDKKDIREMASDVVLRRYPEYSRSCVANNIILFKHNYESPLKLELIKDIETLANGDTLEIVLKVPSCKNLKEEDQ